MQTVPTHHHLITIRLLQIPAIRIPAPALQIQTETVQLQAAQTIHAAAKHITLGTVQVKHALQTLKPLTAPDYRQQAQFGTLFQALRRLGTVNTGNRAVSRLTTTKQALKNADTGAKNTTLGQIQPAKPTNRLKTAPKFQQMPNGTRFQR